MSKFAGNPVLDGHLDQPELAEALDKSQRTIMRWCEDPQDPLPYIKLPNGKTIFNIESVRQWLARREHSALPTPRRRKASAAA
jgi:predicted site-specific integrase-resolvase